MTRRTARRSFLVGAVVCVAAASAAMAAAHGSQGAHGMTPARPSTGPLNDGLPTRWFAETTFSLEWLIPLTETKEQLVTERAHAVVTFNLVQVLRVGDGSTMYQYRPTGTATLSKGCGDVGTPASVPIGPAQGVLGILVSRHGKGPATAEYWFSHAAGLLFVPHSSCSKYPEPTEWVGGGCRNHPRTSPLAARLTGATRCTFEHSGLETFEWCLTRKKQDAGACPDETLAALPRASAAVRGGTVTLDGSRSKGEIVSYQWKLARGSDCPSGTTFDQATELAGARVSFPALCSLRATLTVHDKSSADSATIAVHVRARPWKTPFSPPPVVEGRLNTLLVDGNLALGRNVCVLDGLEGDQHSGHFLHRGGANGPKDGFVLAKISTGPFRGNWYVSKYTAQVRRASLISKDLYPGSDLYAANVAAGHLADFQALFASVSAHEALHSRLVMAALGKADKAKRVEAMVGDDEEEVSIRVNVALIELEDVLAAATTEPKVKALMQAGWSRPATVMIRAIGSSGYVTRTFPSLADLGDESS